MVNEYFINSLNCLTSVNIDGQTTINNTLSVGGKAYLNDAVLIGPLNLLSALNVIGPTTLNTSLSVIGPTTLNTSLSVIGPTTLNQSLSVIGPTTINQLLSVVGPTTLNQSLSVIGPTTLNKTLSVNNDVFVLSSFRVGGDSTILFASNNKVGINTNNPNSELSVVGDISSSKLIYDKSGNSGNWNSVYNSTVATSSRWDSVFSSVTSTSANWNSVYSSTVATSSLWNSVYSSVTATSVNWDSVYSTYKANSATYPTFTYLHNGFLPLSGGTITGNVDIHANVTISGDLSATGKTFINNTLITTTSALSVFNVGANPAIIVTQTGNGDIASFYDGDQNLEILHVGGQNSTFPNVGVKVSNPGKDFTVSGEISASGNIWTTGKILSANKDILEEIIVPKISDSYTKLNSILQPPLCSVFSSVNATSGIWNSVYSSVSATSGIWNSVYSSVSSTSANWNSVFSSMSATSGIWNSVYSSVSSTSANWNSAYSNVNSNSAKWEFANTSVIAKSASWSYAPTGGGSDAVFILNDNIISSSFTIPNGKNAGTFGPVTITNGAQITIPAGSAWTVV